MNKLMINIRKYSQSIIYSNYEDFFKLDGNIGMFLTAEAAQNVCNHVIEYNNIIWRVEGGIWHFPGPELRGDCIWDGPNNPLNYEDAFKNNEDAASFIKEMNIEHNYNVFCLMTKNKDISES